MDIQELAEEVVMEIATLPEAQFISLDRPSVAENLINLITAIVKKELGKAKFERTFERRAR